jgi:hypothetical protein
MLSVLMNDDSLRDALRRNFQYTGHTGVEVNEDGQGRKRMESGSIYPVLLDMFMSGKEKLETIRNFLPMATQLPSHCHARRRVASYAMDESVCCSAGLIS